MASVFLSYDREDSDRVRSIAQAVEKASHDVWWDQIIKGGAQYSKEIDKALKESDAVIVLWSVHSVESAWVRDEAAAGRDSGKLIPVSLDETEPPLGFRQFQTIDMSIPTRRGRKAGLKQMLAAIEELGRPDASKALGPSVITDPRKFQFSGIAIAIVLLAGAAAAILLWHPWTRADLPVVAVRPADANPEALALTRELFVRLGGVQSGRAQSVQLVDVNARETPDLILEVSGTTSTADPSANLVLLRAKDRQLLSSQDFTVPAGETADLKTSVAVAAMSALECATPAVAYRPRLRLDLLKQYLGACARFNALYGNEDVSIVIPQLEQVVKREPRFLPARQKLLLAGAFMRWIPTEVAKPSPQWLRAQIDVARQVEPTIPEIMLAELELLPTTDFVGRLRLVDDLRRRFPDNMFVLGTRAEQLMLVGRINEAVVDAERAARLDPLAPYSRSEYIRALAFSGRLTRAFEELSRFTPLSPIAMGLADTRFRLNMRYGDPRPALNILRTYGTSKAHEAFLLARIEPSQMNIERSIAISRGIAFEQGYHAAHAEVLQAFGRDDEAYQLLTEVPTASVDQFTLQTLFRPTLKNLRQNPRFLKVALRFGLLDYWRKSGKWPDFCLDTELPYNCKSEAAKLG